MSTDEDMHSGVPSLSWFCQRVAAKHVESIADFGPDLGQRYDLLQPILERCGVDDLQRLENTAPLLASKTQDLWKALCSKTYPIESEKFLASGEDAPESWRDHYFLLQEYAKQRFEAIGNKMRNQRQAFESQKKEREVKFTDRVPPRERKTFNVGSSGWGKPAPKTLMQKAMVDSAKIYKGRLEAPYIGVVNTRDYRVTKPVSAPLLPPSTAYSSRVSVSTVRAPKPSGHTTSSTETSPSPPLPPASPTSHRHIGPFPPAMISKKRRPEDRPTMKTQDLAPSRPAKRPKKDPMAALFLPKDRAYSQRPTAAR